MTENVLTGGLSGSQELAVIIGSALVAYGCFRIGCWLLSHNATLIVARKPQPTVHQFPPEPTAYLRDLDGEHRVTEYPPPPSADRDPGRAIKDGGFPPRAALSESDLKAIVTERRPW